MIQSTPKVRQMVWDTEIVNVTQNRARKKTIHYIRAIKYDFANFYDSMVYNLYCILSLSILD